MSASLRTLGQTDIEITPIGLGAWQFSEGRGGATGFWSPINSKETDAIVQAALDGHINWFDTAELYGNGRSERGLSEALKRAGVSNGNVKIATKWSPILRSANSIRKTIDKRLEFLDGFPIDLHQVHNPASFSPPEAEMNAMADLLDAGKIRSAGVSNFSANDMQRAHEQLLKRGFVLASNQVKYSLLDRRIETNGILRAAKELYITIIAYSPLEMGLLSGKFHKDPKLLDSRPFLRRQMLKRKLESSRPLVGLLEKIARAHDATASQVALSWLVNYHGDVVVAIPGASKASHAQESAAAMQLKLTQAELKEIEEHSRQFK